MYIIAGLGNPEKKYDGTRHNIGFRMLDAVAARFGIDVTEKKHKGIEGKGMIGSEKVILAKPLTYMNLSGECVREIADYYKVEPSKIIILFDDISLDVGKIRIRKKGSAGGHNGIKSVIAELGTDDFPRLKFGVGDKPSGGDLVDHVLGRFSVEDEERIQKEMGRVCDAVSCMVNEGYDAAMNKYNG